MAAINTPPSSASGDRKPGVRKSVRIASAAGKTGDKTSGKTATQAALKAAGRVAVKPTLKTAGKSTGKTTAKVIAKTTTTTSKVSENVLDRLQKRLFKALPGVAHNAPGIMTDKGTFHPLYQLVGKPGAVNMNTLFDKKTGKIAEKHGRWRPNKASLPFIEVKPKTQAGFRIDPAKLAMFAHQTVQCPVNGCGFLNNVNNKDSMFRHLDVHHAVRPCTTCGDPRFGFMTVAQRREHVNSKNCISNDINNNKKSNVNKANANKATQPTKRPFSKFVKTNVAPLKGGKNDENTTIKRRLRASTMSTSSTGAERRAEKASVKLQAKAAKVHYEKAHADEINYIFCDRCQRNHIMLSTPEERQHHDTLCVPGATPGRMWCYKCGQVKFLDAESAALNNGSFPHECPGENPDLLVCTLCGFNGIGNFDAMKHHLAHCTGYGGEPAKFCPYCAQQFSSEISTEMRCNHIGICESRPVGAIMATPMSMYPELFKGINIRKRPISYTHDSPRKRVQIESPQVLAPLVDTVNRVKKTAKPPRPANTMTGMTSALAGSSFTLAMRPRDHSKSASPEDPTFKAILAADASAPYAPIGTAGDLMASAATRKVNFATFNGPRRLTIDTDILKATSALKMVSEASPIVENPIYNQPLVPRRLSPSVLDGSPPMVPSDVVFDTSDLHLVDRQDELDVSNIDLNSIRVFNDPMELLANDPEFFGPKSPKLDADFVNAVTHQEYEPTPSPEPQPQTPNTAITNADMFNVTDADMLNVTDADMFNVTNPDIFNVTDADIMSITNEELMNADVSDLPDPIAAQEYLNSLNMPLYTEEDPIAAALAAPLNPDLVYFDETIMRPIPSVDFNMIVMGQAPDLIPFEDENVTPTAANPEPMQRSWGIYGNVTDIQDITQDPLGVYGSPVMNSAVMSIPRTTGLEAPAADIPVSTIAAAAMTSQASRKRGRRPGSTNKIKRVAKTTRPNPKAKVPNTERAAAGFRTLAAKAVHAARTGANAVDNGEGPSTMWVVMDERSAGNVPPAAPNQARRGRRPSTVRPLPPAPTNVSSSSSSLSPAPTICSVPSPSRAQAPVRHPRLAGAIDRNAGSSSNWRATEPKWPTEYEDFVIHKDLYCSRCLRPIPMKRKGKLGMKEGEPSYAEQMAMHEDPARGCGIPHRIGTAGPDGVSLPNKSGWIDLSKKYDGKRVSIIQIRERFARDYPMYKHTAYPADGSGNRAALWVNDPNHSRWSKWWNMPWPPYKGEGPIPRFDMPTRSVIDQEEIEADSADVNSAAGDAVSVDESYAPVAQASENNDDYGIYQLQAYLQAESQVSSYGSLDSLTSGPTNDDDANDNDYERSDLSDPNDDDSTIDEDWSQM